LGVRAGEGPAVTRTVVFFAVSVGAISLGANAADTLFFLRFGVDELPLMIMLSGPVVMVATLIFAAGLGRVGPRAWIPWVLTGSSLLLGLERIGIAAEIEGIYPAVWLIGQAILMVTFTVMWVLAGEICTTRQAKRLFPLFASAGIAGGVVGNAATGPLASLIGAEDLLLAQGTLLAVGAIISASVGRRHIRPRPTNPGSVRSDLRQGLRVTANSRMLRMVAVVGLSLNILFFMVVFPFSEAVTASFASEEEVAGFLGTFSAVATAATFAVSLLITNRLLSRYGVVPTMAMVPLVYVVGFVSWLFFFDLPTLSIVRGAQWVAVNALGAAAWGSLFNVLPKQRRGQVMAFMTAGPAQLGTVLSGSILILGAALAREVTIVFGVLVAAVTLAIVWRMRTAYGEALVGAVRDGMVEVFTGPIAAVPSASLDADATAAIARSLDDDNAQTRAAAVSILARLDQAQAQSLVDRALRDPDPAVRIAAVEAMGRWPTVDPETLATLLSDDHAGVKEKALRLIIASGLELPVGTSVALSDRDPRVRAMSAAIIGGDTGREVVQRLLGSDQPHEVVAGLQALRERPELHRGEPGSLRRLLDDPSVLVRRAAGVALSVIPEGVDILLQVLEDGSVRATDAAVRALRDAGMADEHLAAWASREVARARFLRAQRVVLERQEPASPAEAYLARLLAARERRLESWAIMALTREGSEKAMSTVMRGIWQDDAETRSQALEALDSLTSRAEARELTSLIEMEGDTTDDRDRGAALRDLAADFDEWISALAKLSIAVEGSPRDPGMSRWDPPEMQIARTLDTMECVLSLSHVPMFSDIDPEDLEKLAAVTAERRFDPDELIYREGDEGDEMIILVRGSAVASQTRAGEVRVLRHFGPGDHAGELALLRSRPRVSDVVAGPNGATALALGNAEFQAILEERPEVAMAMLGTLAERIATS